MSGSGLAAPFPNPQLSDKIKKSKLPMNSTSNSLVDLKRITVMLLLALIKKGISLSVVIS